MRQRTELSKKLIKTFISKENPTVLDIGSYDGFDAAELAMQFENPQVHCFEADPRSIELWKRECKDNRKLILQPFAVCNIDGMITFNLSDSDTRRHYDDQKSWSASSSLRAPQTHLKLFPDVYFKEQVQVPATKLDTWHMKNLSNKIIDFIWCDVNGAESEVLIGGLRTLMQYTRYLYVEFSDKELYSGQVTKKQLLSLLPDYFTEVGVYNFKGNFGNVLLKNEVLN